MCRERPWFTSVCGIPLRSVVMDLGIIQLGLTLVITSLNVIKYVDTIDTCSGALCLGPVFKVSRNNDGINIITKYVTEASTINVCFSTQCSAPLAGWCALSASLLAPFRPVFAFW